MMNVIVEREYEEDRWYDECFCTCGAYLGRYFDAKETTTTCPKCGKQLEYGND